MSKAIDPVCEMEVELPSELHTTFEGKTYHFCGESCLNEFKANPAEYLGSSKDQKSVFKTYAPLFLIGAYITGLTLLMEVDLYGWLPLQWSLERMMSDFMAGFFLVFSFFKFLNLRAFADAYQGYDLIARRFRGYAYAYPFIELLLGLAFWFGIEPFQAHVATFIVMGVSSLGVLKSVLKKQTIQCACLGTVFNLPMSKVTLIEDLLMVAMALTGIIHGLIIPFE